MELAEVHILVQNRDEISYQFSERITDFINTKVSEPRYSLNTISFTSASDGRQTCNIVLRNNTEK